MNPDRLAALEEERDFLLRSLADLDREHAAGDVTDEDYQTLRDDYTTRAAAVLRSIEGGRAALPARRPLARKRVAIGVGAGIGIAAVIATLLVGSASDRRDGDTITGGPAGTDPNSLLVEARSQMTADPATALELFTQVLEQEPDNVEARTYAGWVIALDALSSGASGDALVTRGELALQLVETARNLDPSYVDAQCFTAIIRFRMLGDAVGAAEPLAACRAGDLPADVAPLITQLGAAIDDAVAAADSVGVPTTAP